MTGGSGFIGSQTSYVLLQKRYKIVVEYFERGGQESLKVNWKGPGFDWMEIPKFKLFHTLG